MFSLLGPFHVAWPVFTHHWPSVPSVSPSQTTISSFNNRVINSLPVLSVLSVHTEECAGSCLVQWRRGTFWRVVMGRPVMMKELVLYTLNFRLQFSESNSIQNGNIMWHLGLALRAMKTEAGGQRAVVGSIPKDVKHLNLGVPKLKLNQLWDCGLAY